MSQVRTLSAAPISMIVHIIGNGPSKKDFTNDPVGDVYGCNLSDLDRDLTATFIMDKVVLHHITNNGLKLKFPVIIPDAYRRIAGNLVILDTIPTLLENGESTGHHGVQYLLRKRYKQIHLWGFDSLYTESIESDSHTKIPEGIHFDSNWRRWRNNWDKIFNSDLGRECQFIIH